jgi:hypothetical protein
MYIFGQINFMLLEEGCMEISRFFCLDFFFLGLGKLLVRTEVEN